jgi:hypothetical protein
MKFERNRLMNKSSRTSTVVAKTLLLLFVCFMAAIFLMKPPLTSSTARAQVSSSPAQGQRVFENTIPENAPIRIKIKKEKERSFKDLKDENWLREFELEVVNTGDKPIFFIYINLLTDVKIGDSPLIFALVYGRAELGDIVTKAQPDDPSIKPGETYVFKIHPGQVQAWEKSVREKSQSDASRIKAKIQMLSYGDGTGYFVDRPYPPSDKRQSILDDQMQPLNKDGPKTSRWPVGQPQGQPKASSIIDLPVTSLPANFLNSDSSRDSLPKGVSVPNASCGLFDYCVGIIPYSAVVCYNCPPQNRPGLDSAGQCVELTFGTLRCFVGSEPYLCQTIDVDPCGFGPGPTPVPTPHANARTVSILQRPGSYWPSRLLQSV